MPTEEKIKESKKFVKQLEKDRRKYLKEVANKVIVTATAILHSIMKKDAENIKFKYHINEDLSYDVTYFPLDQNTKITKKQDKLINVAIASGVDWVHGVLSKTIENTHSEEERKYILATFIQENMRSKELFFVGTKQKVKTSILFDSNGRPIQ